MFQSTRPRGARPYATRTEDSAIRRFNPRARAGRDLIALDNAMAAYMFQSTRPRGARRGISERV